MEGATTKKKIRTHSKKDLISRLPEEILHQILCSLSQKEAIRTCVLSKAWRYLGCTRPKIEWKDFKSHAALDRILRAYRRRNLGLDEFSLLMSGLWDDWFLQKWIPIIIHKLRVKTFRIHCSDGRLFQLPSLIVESDHIQNLSLKKCVLRSPSEVQLYLQRLQTLRLERVDIREDILNSILSNCPFLEDVSLTHCKGFKRIKLYVNNNNKPTKLTQFCFEGNHSPRDVSIQIGDDDSQTHTSIDTDRCKPLESAHRRRLSLRRVHLLSYSFSCSFTILKLYGVYITERIVLDNILSYCPVIKNVSLKYCKGFETIEMLNNTPTNLQHFCFHGKDDHLVSIEIGNNIKTLRSIDISHCLFSVSHNKPLECPRLTRLILTNVQLVSSESFSCNLHSLEELKLDQCSDIEEFKMSSRSMKRLSINNVSKPFKVTINAPSMVDFNYEGVLPQSISFATTCSDDLWKSRIILGSSVFNDHCSNELYDLLKASSQSKVFLELDIIDIRRFLTQIHIGDNRLPLAVEHLRIRRSNDHSSAAPFLNMLFRVFRPSFVYLMNSNTNQYYREIVELLFKEREPAHCYIWQSVLEGVSLQVKYLKQRKWQPIEYTSFTYLSKKGADGKGVEEYSIQLKWRD